MKRLCILLFVTSFLYVMQVPAICNAAPDNTTIHQAAEKGAVREVKRLLESGTDINARGEHYRTPLHIAAVAGRTDIVKLLIEMGADLNARDAGNRVPLHQAAWAGREDIVRLLLDMNVELDVGDNTQETPLHYASRTGGRAAIARFLVEQGADINARDRDQRTPLHHAVITGQSETAMVLIAGGAEVNIEERDGTTPLHWASATGQRGTAEKLIARGAEINAKNNFGKTPVYRAAETGQAETLFLLINRGADINKTDNDKRTPLHTAVFNGHSDVAGVLIGSGADLNILDSNNKSPLLLASENGYTQTACLLIKKGADVNIKDDNGWTPLHWATDRKQEDVAELLIDRGADLDAREKTYGSSPLHWAAFRGQVEVLDKLLNHGADVNTADKDGRTPFDWAQFGNRLKAVELLRRRNGRTGITKTGPEGKSENTGKNLLANPLFIMEDGEPQTWRYRGVARGETPVVSYDSEKNIFTISGRRFQIFQSVDLEPGHYLLRVLAKTNSFLVSLSASPGNRGFRGTDYFRIGTMPVGISEDYRWAELPFCIGGTDIETVSVGINNPYGPMSRHIGTLHIKEMQLLRLGDTAMPRQLADDRWIENSLIPVSIFRAHPRHGLEVLNESANWNRPGKVIFKDSFMGTELWLMTQEGRTDHIYVGIPTFSNEGKYQRINRPSRGFLRTDGSERHIDNDLTGMLWLLPWEQKRLPQNSEPADWIAVERTTAEVVLYNLVTNESFRIELPSRPGWEIVHYPSFRAGNRGPNIKSISHETIAWMSDDKKYIARSDMEGENFKRFEIKSISARPEKDEIKPFLTLRCGTSSELRWRNAVDKNSIHYFAFELNSRNFFKDPENPYQAFFLPLNLDDMRGLLRAVPNPAVEILPTHWAGWKWEDLGAGLPRTTSLAALLLEDGTLVHMSALGMHSCLHSTVRKHYSSGKVKFLGSYIYIDRISWPDPVNLDEGFAVVESYQEPHSPVVMIDLENETIWTLALSNFHDYVFRIRSRSRAVNFFRLTPNLSPDFTKVSYYSSMLTGNNMDRPWADTYVAVARYPQPPVNVSIEGDELIWEKPRYGAEIMGFNIYKSDESGKGDYVRLNSKPVRDTRYRLNTENSGFYVLTSVEYSGLESRAFSEEAVIGREDVLYRRFYQPTTGNITAPMVPFFEPRGASDLYAVAVTDPELVYKQRLQDGLQGSVKLDIDIPAAGRWRIMARVRGMFDIERATYATGWHPTGTYGRGSFTVKTDDKTSGSIPVNDFAWRWKELDTAGIDLPSSGRLQLEFTTSDAGIALDNILVTNDPHFIPRHRDNTPAHPPSVPGGIEAEIRTEELEWNGYNIRPPYVKLTWDHSTAPQGVRYYNVYRSLDSTFRTNQSTLIGSSSEPLFIDPELAKGKHYYRVKAIDNWDNRSEASEAIQVTNR